MKYKMINESPSNIYTCLPTYSLTFWYFLVLTKKHKLDAKAIWKTKSLQSMVPILKTHFFKKNCVSFMVFCYILRGWYFKLKISFHFSYLVSGNWNLSPGTWPLASTWHLGTCCAPDTWFLPDTWNLRTWNLEPVNLAPTFRNFCHDFNVFALRLFENPLKELQNYNRKLFLCPPQK